MTDFLVRRWLTGIALLLMVVAMSGYAGHQHEHAGAAQGTSHCDVCAAFSAVADLPISPSIVSSSRPAAWVQWVAGRDAVFTVLRTQRARAPPSRH